MRHPFIIALLLLGACASTTVDPQPDPASTKAPFAAEVDHAIGKLTVQGVPRHLWKWANERSIEHQILLRSSDPRPSADIADALAMWCIDAVLKLERGRVFVESDEAYIEGETDDVHVAFMLRLALGERARVTVRPRSSRDKWTSQAAIRVGEHAYALGSGVRVVRYDDNPVLRLRFPWFVPRADGSGLPILVYFERVARVSHIRIGWVVGDDPHAALAALTLARVGAHMLVEADGTVVQTIDPTLGVDVRVQPSDDGEIFIGLLHPDPRVGFQTMTDPQRTALTELVRALRTAYPDVAEPTWPASATPGDQP